MFSVLKSFEKCRFRFALLCLISSVFVLTCSLVFVNYVVATSLIVSNHVTNGVFLAD